MKKALVLAFLISTLLSQAQEKYTLSGYILDKTNGESLIGSTILVKEISGGGVSNVYGFYSITMPAGTYTVDFRYIGYDTQTKTIELTQNVKLDIEMVETGQELEAVVITAEREDANITDIQMSTAKIDMKSIEKMPAFAGEVDIIKSIQLLPGVSTVGEGASGFNVRGGGVGQNLVLQDEAPVYQSSHLFGFFSVFNPDAVKDVKLYKGGIPANYGGRLSSILDIRMKEGNNRDFDVTGGIGTVFSRLAIEGPIAKEKASFIVAGRRSYADVIARPFTDVFDDGAGLYFYDLTAKTNWDINDKNKIYLSGYFGRDVFKFDANQGFDWGNQTATLRWNHLFSERFFANFTTFISNYDYSFSFGETANDKFDWSSQIVNYDFKPQFTYFINTNNELSFGGEAMLYRFKPANAVGVSDGVSTNISLDEKRSLEASLYVTNDQKITQKLSAQYGLRLSSFYLLGPGTSYTYGETQPGIRRPVIDSEAFEKGEVMAQYAFLEPRLAINYQLNTVSSIKASYNKMNQYVHLISNTVASTPIDVWQPSTANLKPQNGNQVALGYFRNFNDNLIVASVESYYKWSKNEVDYIDGADIFINEYLEGDLLSGLGRAYGLEFYLQKNKGKFTGWASYTLGKSEMLVDGINYLDDYQKHEGKWYPTRYDQRHNFKLTANYEINQRISLSGIFSFISGTPTTFPNDRYSVAGYVIPLLDNQRNNFRIPDYHRLDFSVTFNQLFMGKKNPKNSDYLVVSIYNVYARENPFAIYFSNTDERPPYNAPTGTSATQTAILGTILPAISYNFKF